MGLRHVSHVGRKPVKCLTLKKLQQIFQGKPAGEHIKFKVAFYIVTPKSNLPFECGEAPYI